MITEARKKALEIWRDIDRFPGQPASCIREEAKQIVKCEKPDNWEEIIKEIERL